jgi:predicted nucleic acid-binding protein
MPEAWVINASPLILLAKARLMERVVALADPLVIPAPVAEEIRRGAPDDPGLQWLEGPGRTLLKQSVTEPASLAACDIGSGERSVIAWALVYPEFTAVMDDLAARSEAERRGVKVLGTVGIILRLKSADLIPEAKASLTRIRQAGAHMSEALFQEALRRAGEA